jgi:pimeloyl-ACP methyl ester carboxylesterase
MFLAAAVLPGQPLLDLQDAVARLRTKVSSQPSTPVEKQAIAKIEAWLRQEIDRTYPPKSGQANIRWYTYGKGLKARIASPANPGSAKLPLLVLMHGFRGEASDFHDGTLTRFATSYGNGVFVAAVSLRGRDGSPGQPDAGGEEITDIAGAVESLLQDFPQMLDRSNVHIAGYSGGGGNALSAAARYPALFKTATSFFGISDYALWFRQANADQRKYLLLWAGSEANLLSRDVCARLANYPGTLRLYHDRGDDNVPVVHSERVLACRPESFGNFSEPGDEIRWLHQNPNGDPPVRQAEREFLLRVALWNESAK